MNYKAFISYSRKNGKLAMLIKRGLENITKPWYKRRALDIFLDQSDLSVSPNLWKSITSALDRSEYFILLASPEAAGSEWVVKEVDYWLQHKSIDNFILVVASDQIRWNAVSNNFDWHESNPIYELLNDRFPGGVPLYIDFSSIREVPVSYENKDVFNGVVKLSAYLNNTTVEDISGETTRQHRKTMLIRNAVIAALSVLLVGLGILLIKNNSTNKELKVRIKEVEESKARIQRELRISKANELVGFSSKEKDTDPTLCLLLSKKAFDLNPSPVTESNLLGNYYTLLSANELFYKSITLPLSNYLRYSNVLDKNENDIEPETSGFSNDSTIGIQFKDGSELRYLLTADSLQYQKNSRDNYDKAAVKNKIDISQDTLKIYNAKSELIKNEPLGVKVDNHLASPDSTLIAIRSKNQLLIYDVQQGKYIHKSTFGKAESGSLHPAVNNRFFLSATNRVILYSWAGKELSSLEIPENEKIWSIIRPDGYFVTSSSLASRRFNTWEFFKKEKTSENQTGELKINGRIMGAKNPTVKNYGKVSSSSFKGSLEIYAGRKVLLKHVGKSSRENVIVESPEEPLLAVVSDLLTVTLIDTEQGVLRKTFKLSKPVNNISFSGKGSYLLITFSDFTAMVYNVKSNAELSMRGHRADIIHAGFSPDETKIFTLSNDQTIKIWPLTGLSKMDKVVMDNDCAITDLNITQGRRWTSVPANCQSLSYNNRIMVKVPEEEDDMPITDFTISPRKKFLISVQDNEGRIGDVGGLTVLDSAGKLLKKEGVSYYSAAAFSQVSDSVFAFGSRSRNIFSGGKEEYFISIVKWDGTDWSDMATFDPFRNLVKCISFSRNDQYIAAGSGDHSVSIFEWNQHNGGYEKNGQLPRDLTKWTMKNHTETVNCVTFSLNNQHLLSGDEDGKVIIWSWKADKKIIFDAHAGAVISADFSTNASYVVTVGNDKMMKVWKIDYDELTAREVYRYGDRINGLTAARFLDEKNNIVVSDATGKYQSFGWSSETVYGQLLKRISTHEMSDFSPEQKKYFGVDIVD